MWPRQSRTVTSFVFCREILGGSSAARPSHTAATESVASTECELKLSAFLKCCEVVLDVCGVVFVGVCELCPTFCAWAYDCPASAVSDL